MTIRIYCVLFVLYALLAFSSAQPMTFSDEDSATNSYLSLNDPSEDEDGATSQMSHRPMIKLKHLFEKKSGSIHQQPQAQHQIKEKLEKMFSPDIFNMMVATMMEHQKDQQNPFNDLAALNDPELIKSKMANLGYEPASSASSSQNGKKNNDMMHLFHRFG